MEKQTSYHRPFAGVRVVDLSQGIAGPYAAMLMAQNGAEVIKVEPPGGDWSRGLGTRYDDATVLSVSGNRGKRSIVLDLKQPAGRDVVHRLAKSADVVMESFRPGVVKRLGVDYETLKPLNEKLIYVSVSGYGQTGPYAENACTDTVSQAFSGLMAVNRGADDIPHRVGFVVVDMTTALYAFQAVSAALYARDVGKLTTGRLIDVSLMQSAAAVQAYKIYEAVTETEAIRNLNAPAGTYRTKNGWLAVTLVKETQFTALAGALGHPEWAEDPRFASFQQRDRNLEDLVARMQPLFAAESTAYWQQRLNEAGVMAHPVNDYADWLDDPHVTAVDAAPRVHQPGIGSLPTAAIPGQIPLAADDSRLFAPGLGQDGEAILQAAGYNAAEIAQLRQNRIFR